MTLTLIAAPLTGEAAEQGGAVEGPNLIVVEGGDGRVAGPVRTSASRRKASVPPVMVLTATATA